MTPVDAVAKRHDEEYGKIQGRYDGMHQKSNDMHFVWFINYLEPNAGLHLELLGSDAALVGRSWTGIISGLWSGQYRLEYDQRWGMLLSDLAWALGITVVYGASALLHLAYLTNPYLFALSAAFALYVHYDLGAKISGGWKYYGGQISGGWKHAGGQASDAWKLAATLAICPFPAQAPLTRLMSLISR